MATATPVMETGTARPTPRTAMAQVRRRHRRNRKRTKRQAMKSASWDNAATGERCDSQALFRSFFMGGFECSTFYRRNGQRLDLVASTKHDRFCRQDYERLKQQGLLTAREGIRWHLIEKNAGQYDFSSAMPM